MALWQILGSVILGLLYGGMIYLYNKPTDTGSLLLCFLLSLMIFICTLVMSSFNTTKLALSVISLLSSMLIESFLTVVRILKLKA